uniref:Uncharacterized protein n=1 Tax=uncultured bacterium contig00032 TaxID=1181521 RepID=A0A806KFC2_9BACT|nr:hypothetical protein [uncultured bacterium contig00032]
MGKKTYFINGKYYIIDDETGDVKRVIIQEEPNIPPDDLKQLVKILATEKEGK